MAQYYYTDGKERYGPFSPEELKAKNITRETLVWTEGLADWIPAGNITELQTLFEYSNTNLPPIMTGPPVAEKAPKNWLVESILVTLLCCLPFGVVGIIFATKVDSLWASGDRDGAMKASSDAGKWVKIGFFCGIGVYLIYGLLMIFGVVAGIGASTHDL